MKELFVKGYTPTDIESDLRRWRMELVSATSFLSELHGVLSVPAIVLRVLGFGKTLL